MSPELSRSLQAAPPVTEIELKLTSMPYEILHGIIDFAIPVAPYTYALNCHYNTDGNSRRVEFLFGDPSNVSVLFVAKDIRQIARYVLFERARAEYFLDESIPLWLRIET
ncbi:uncharacterized protein AB675_11766 [Cyphellophora attinorum]|uniref:Uncharacterized protein n=1 Tax=Cyphellophora attinorum TaxID=1664694 RepID=A0A0N1HNX5_9EURO|nr:uncharacterized protein AB675_11766 [Phialophora attinorum]KPI36845.1 hypothetical protein AB675_11766 [Phialophora attinorum]